MFNLKDNKPNRWAVLALLGVAQLMVVLDGTIVNTALPSAQAALHFSTDSRQWIITAYALAFGSLLLLGGKLGDLFGRKWTFIAGLVGFSLASVLGGLADSFTVLVAARALQGAFAALLAPSALGLLTVTFAGTPDRPKAFGIFGAIAAGGASVGLLLGGVLTTALSWRWCLYVNPLIAIPTAALALRILTNQRDPRRPRIDLPGTLLAAGGTFALVYGFSNPEMHSWSAPATVIALAASPMLLIGFVLVQRRVANPLLPLHVAWNRARGGAYLSVVVAAAGMFSVLLFLTFYMQSDLGFSALTDGLAFLPMSVTIARDLHDGPDPSAAEHRSQTDLHHRNGARRARHDPAHPTQHTRCVPRRPPARTHRLRDGDGVHPRDRLCDRHARCRAQRGRRRRRPGQHLPANRRVCRDRRAEHGICQRRGQLRDSARTSRAHLERSCGSRLHHHLYLGGRSVRPRPDRRAADPSRTASPQAPFGWVSSFRSSRSNVCCCCSDSGLNDSASTLSMISAPA